MSPRVLLVFLALMLTAALAAAEIGIGTSRDEVLDQLGKPTSIARRGDHEIFLYPKGGRIEFVGGKVVDVKGPLPAALTPVAPPSAASPASGASTAPPPASSVPPAKEKAQPSSAPAAKTSTPAKKNAVAPAKPTGDESPAAAANELAKHVEKMKTPWGEAPEKETTHSPLESLPSFLTGLLLRFGFTILALKLAFKFWEMDAFWVGIFAIAGIDLALHAGFELLGPATGGFTTMGAVENGVPGLVLIYTINRFCFNKRLQNAVLTAAAVKLVVTLCYVFAGVAALNAIYA